MSYSVDILNNIRMNASTEYQQRIPLATQQNIREIGNALQEYNLLYNEFCEALVNKIGKTILETKMFNNRLARFKSGTLLSEQDIEEIFVVMAKAEGAYNPQGLNPLGRRNYSDVYVIYHRQNRRDKYCISIGDVDFVRNFRNEGTLANFISAQINSVYSADSYDEWCAMKNLLATYGFSATYAKTSDVALDPTKTYYTKNGDIYVIVAEPDVSEIGNYYEIATYTTGYFDYEVPSLESATDKRTFAKDFVKALRKAVQDLSFASTQYNVAHVMQWSHPADMVLLVNKDVLVEVDVEQLASAFHTSETDMKVIPTIIPMDDFGTLPDTLALLVDGDIFRVYDTLSRTETQRNADGLFTNYFYHHWQILSLSTFKNAVRLKSVEE